MEYIFVATGNQGVATGGSALVTSGNSVGIADGQLGTLSTDVKGADLANLFITAGRTALTVKTIKVLRGTANSTNLSNVSPFKLNEQAYLSTPDIHGDKIVEVSATLPEVAQYASNYLHTFSAPAVGTDYSLTITLEGASRDIEFAPQRLDTSVYTVTSPAVAPTAPTDWVLQNLAIKANRESIWRNGAGKPFVVFGIATDGTPGVVVSGIAAGTSLPLMTADGLQTNVIADIPLVRALQTAVTAAAFAQTVSIVNLGSVTPGSAATVDALLVVGLDEAMAVVYDEETRNKTQVEAASNLTNTRVISSRGKDWVGLGKQWKAQWRRFYGKQHYFENYVGHPYVGSVDSAPSHIVDTQLYTSTIITFNTVESPTSNYAQTIPHRLVILLPAAIENPTAVVYADGAVTPYTVATTATTTVTELNASLGAWLLSAGTAFSNHKYLEGAAAATPFI